MCLEPELRLQIVPSKTPGLINTSQQVGGALGLAVLATVANSRTANAMASSQSTLKHALTLGFHSAFLTGAGFALLGLALGLVLIRREDSRRHIDAAVAELAA